MRTQQRVRPRYGAIVSVLALLLGGAFVGVTSWTGAVERDGVAFYESLEASHLVWPVEGAAAVAVGDGPTQSNSDQAAPMASISKIITALMILEERPLARGEQGETYWMTEREQQDYLDAFAIGKSVLEVPVDGVLTQRQLLEGMLVGSACNYAEYLVSQVWGSNDAFVSAASSFLARHQIDGVTMVEPTGFDAGNVATPAALIAIGRLALAEPTVADIVRMQSVELPGAGYVENTNDLLADPGVVGIKTGTLERSNVLAAKDLVQADGSTVRVFAVVMNQPDDLARWSEARSLFDQVERNLRSAG